MERFYSHCYSRRSPRQCWAATFPPTISTSWRGRAIRKPPSTKWYTESSTWRCAPTLDTIGWTMLSYYSCTRKIQGQASLSNKRKEACSENTYGSYGRPRKTIGWSPSRSAKGNCFYRELSDTSTSVIFVKSGLPGSSRERTKTVEAVKNWCYTI